MVSAILMLVCVVGVFLMLALVWKREHEFARALYEHVRLLNLRLVDVEVVAEAAVVKIAEMQKPVAAVVVAAIPQTQRVRAGRARSASELRDWLEKVEPVEENN